MNRKKFSKWVTFFIGLILCSQNVLAEGLTPASPATPTAVAGLPEKKSRVDELKAQIKKNPKNLKLVVELAQEFYDLGEYEKTTLLLWKQIDRLNREAMLLLIKAHEKREQPVQILKVTQLLLAKNAKDAEALTYEGRAYLMKIKQNPPAEVKRLKYDSLALESLKKATEADPKYRPAYEELVKIYDKKERPNFYELRLLYQDMIEKIGPQFEFYAKLCEINFIDGVNDPAIAACKKAIQLNPEDAQSYIYLGQVHRQIGNNEEGLKTLKDAALRFTKSAQASEAYALALTEEKNYIDAFKFYELCLGVNSKHEKCLVGASTSGAEIQKYEKSLNYIKSACEIDRKNAVTARRIASNLKLAKELEWSQKFESAAQRCSGN